MNAQLQELWRLAPMHAEHLPQVLELERRVYPFPWTESILRDCLKVGYSSWIVTDRAGVIIAYALMSMAVGEAHLLNLCVAPELRRQGLARYLLDHLLRIARAANTTIVLLEVRRSNKAAIRLYESYNFQRLGLRKGYYPAQDGREDAFVLGFDIV